MIENSLRYWSYSFIIKPVHKQVIYSFYYGLISDLTSRYFKVLWPQWLNNTPTQELRVWHYKSLFHTQNLCQIKIISNRACPLTRLMLRTLPGQGRLSGLSENLSNPEGAPAIYCVLFWSYIGTREAAAKKKLEEKEISFLPAVYLLCAFDSALYCGGFFSLLVHN